MAIQVLRKQNCLMWHICFFINTPSNKTWLGWEEAKVTWSLKDKLTWPALECQRPSAGGRSQPQTTSHGRSQKSEYFDLTLPSFFHLPAWTLHWENLTRSWRARGPTDVLPRTKWTRVKRNLERHTEEIQQNTEGISSSSPNSSSLLSSPPSKVASIMDILKSQTYRVLWVVRTST